MNAQNVIPASVPIPPDPVNNPAVNKGPPPGIPAAACFGPGSQGQILLNGQSILLGPGPTTDGTIVDAGSDAFFGLELGADYKLTAVDGCSGVYAWDHGDGLAPSFQVDCSTNEFGSYWNGVKQTCYAYSLGGGVFYTFCGNNLGAIYSCLQGAGMYGTVNTLVHSWVAK